MRRTSAVEFDTWDGATSAGGQPHVVPLAFHYNPETDTIAVGGHDFAKRKKYRDVHRNPRVAIVIDDLARVDPWRPRMIEVRGEAEIAGEGSFQVNARSVNESRYGRYLPLRADIRRPATTHLVDRTLMGSPL